MISFMISVVPPKIDWTRLSPQSSQSWRSAADWCSCWSRRAPSGQREPRPSPGAIWAAITRQGIVSPRRNPPRIPAVDTDIESGELITAQLPEVLGMRDASDSSQPGGAVLPRAAAWQSVPQPG